MKSRNISKKHNQETIPILLLRAILLRPNLGQNTAICYCAKSKPINWKWWSKKASSVVQEPSISCLPPALPSQKKKAQIIRAPRHEDLAGRVFFFSSGVWCSKYIIYWNTYLDKMEQAVCKLVWHRSHSAICQKCEPPHLTHRCITNI